MMKKAPTFIPRDGGFSIREIASYLRISPMRVTRLAAKAGVRMRFVAIGEKPRYAPFTAEETRAIMLRFHVKRG